MKPVSVVRILGIETSCDETSVALMEWPSDAETPSLLTHEIASQIEQHRPYGGVVPELATRQHMKHLDGMVGRTLSAQGWQTEDLTCVAVTMGPGLASSLMVGTAYARGLALAAGLPVAGIHHMEGHLLSVFLGSGCAPQYPHLALVISGGHTLLVAVLEPWQYQILGKTRDDAVGEAYDKVAKLLGLSYPGGPEVERRGRDGDPRRFIFPRSMLHSGDDAFSFSGLKTAVRYELEKWPPPWNDQLIADICAGFQSAVVDILVGKCLRVLQRTHLPLLTVSGGVAANQSLISALDKASADMGVRVLSAPRQYSTDNAAMIAHAAAWRHRDGVLDVGPSDVMPVWPLDALNRLEPD